MEKSRRVEEAGRELLKEYLQNQKKSDFALMDLPLRTGDYEEEDGDAASYSSSDLFELDHLAVMEKGRYREELPVYETTHEFNEIRGGNNKQEGEYLCEGKIKGKVEMLGHEKRESEMNALFQRLGTFSIIEVISTVTCRLRHHYSNPNKSSQSLIFALAAKDKGIGTGDPKAAISIGWGGEKMNPNFRDSPEILQSLNSPRLSRQSSKSDSKRKQQVEAPSPVPSRCCRGFGNVKTSGPTLSILQYQQQLQHSERLEGKVIDLEKEVQRQKELRVLYRKRMERTQDYLRYCLEIAQENGILDLITHSKGELQQSPLSVHSVNSTASPQIRSPIHRRQHHPDLAAIIDHAKIHGWYIDPLEIQLEEKIGQGTTAEIYSATWRGCDVAVKCMTTDFFRTNGNGVIFFAQEVETLSRQRHRFVLQLMGACLDPPHHAWLVTERVSTTLKDWLHGPGKRRRDRQIPLPSLKDRVTRALEIAQAMQYLHEQNPKVIHRDLKPSNIFLDDDLHVRIADFGHARFLSDHEMALTGETGTYVYMAPELIRCEPYNEKCDIYSFGIILNELVTGNHPYIETDYSPTKIAVEVVEGKLRPRAAEDREGEVEELVRLIRLCWDGNPTTRPSFATITSTLKACIKRASLE
ncbi:uncharacterized protein LOC129302127 [Prosopis cineraria]|uniref:uncharacterized protein LOC129302127 n=1 Tax=Prosopis cineraria TaxID=364024 RepID=UPI00240F481F|nr:uncharacterized protein LOC129302127 [Prosopis cineraria]